MIPVGAVTRALGGGVEVEEELSSVQKKTAEKVPEHEALLEICDSNFETPI